MRESLSGLHDHLGYWLRRLSDQVHLSFERKLAVHGVTVSQWNVLVTLYRGQGQTVAEVARLTANDAAAVSRLVDRLAAKGLVTRSADPASRRRALLTLTPRATGLVPRLIELADQNDAAFFGTLSSAQRGRLATQLRQLTAAAEALPGGNQAGGNEAGGYKAGDNDKENTP
jgi:DNA-binding MarR family transcriptional regulator